MTKIKSPHSDFRLDLLSPVDVRAIGLDQMLTQLWLKLLLENRPPARRTRDFATIAELAQEIERDGNEHFRGFRGASQATESWLRADLVRPLKREPTKYTVARPLHAHAVRLRSNNRQANDSNASEAVYAWLWHADKSLLKDLRRLIAAPIDRASADLVTLALFHLGGEQEEDGVATGSDGQPEPSRPLSMRHATTYADDLRRLMAYEQAMPRPALIAHLQRLTGFHLGMYLLKVFEIVTATESSGAMPRVDPALELIVDFGDDVRASMARLAERSWQRREQSLQRYVRAHLALKKLHQFAEREEALRKIPLPTTLDELAALETTGAQERLEAHFDAQLASLVGHNDKDSAAQIESLAQEYRDMGMSAFRVYHSIIVQLKGKSWVAYHRQLLDSILSKNSSEGLLRQPLGGRSQAPGRDGAGPARDAALAALVQGPRGEFVTQPLRVDALISHLEQRYGLCIAAAPAALANDFETARTLATNVDRFKARLRETGLFRDLSDAFVAQLVRPRISIG